MEETMSRFWTVIVNLSFYGLWGVGILLGLAGDYERGVYVLALAVLDPVSGTRPVQR